MNASVATTSKVAAKPPLRLLSVILLMGGAFCCPITTWAFFKGYLSLSDALFVAAFAIHLTRSGRLGANTPGILMLLGLSAGVFTLSGLITFAMGGIYSSPVVAFKLVFAMSIAPYAISVMVGDDRRAASCLLIGWLAGAVFNALIVLASRYGVAVLGFYDSYSGEGYRAQGLTYHPNSLSYSSALLIPVATYLWTQTRTITARLALATSMLLLLNAIYVSGSRASLLALLIGTLPWLPLLMCRRIWPLFFAIGVGVLASGFLAFTLGAQFGALQAGFEESAIARLFGGAPTELSDAGRRWALAYSWSEFQESPLFGVGWLAVRWSHSNILAILHSGGLFGLLGLVCWATAIVVAVVRISAVQRVVPVTWDRTLLMMILSSLIIWFVNGAFQPLLLDRNGYLLIGILLALNAQAAQLWHASQSHAVTRAPWPQTKTGPDS